MRITSIECHPITLEFHDWLADGLLHFHGSSGLKRCVFIVHTDVGLEGVGEGGFVPEDVREKYIGTDPVRLDRRRHVAVHRQGDVRPDG